VYQFGKCEPVENTTQAIVYSPKYSPMKRRGEEKEKDGLNKKIRMRHYFF
jgi:hypothetical protein